MEVRPISDSQRGWKAKHQKTWLLTCLPPVKKSAYQLELRFRITQWARNIMISMLTSQQHFVEFVNLWTRLQSVELRPGVPDQIEWKLSANGEYSTKSA